MKNASFYIVMLITAAIAFTSCSKDSSFAVHKRQYRNGYYTASSKGKPASERIITQNEKKNFGINAVSSNADAEIKPPAAAENLSSNSVQPQFENSPALEKAERCVKSSPAEKSSGAVNRIENKIAEKKSAAEKIISKHTKGRDADTVMHVLLIIGVVILALWVISLISGGWGLGGLEHILLVVALVLLIIWLVRRL